jgi:hypothetical protein
MSLCNSEETWMIDGCFANDDKIQFLPVSDVETFRNILELLANVTLFPAAKFRTQHRSSFVFTRGSSKGNSHAWRQPEVYCSLVSYMGEDQTISAPAATRHFIIPGSGVSV